MAAVVWLINGSAPADLGLSGLKLTYTSLAPDVLEFVHLTAAWDAASLFDYGTVLTLTRDAGLGGGPVTVFVGKVRTMPRFIGPAAESLSYKVHGPWDWLQRLALLQECGYVTDPSTSTSPTLVPQGLAILGQNASGISVDLAASLAAVLASVTGSVIGLSVGSGFSYATPWDEMSDSTLADAVVRLLQTAPDSVTWFDYTTTPPNLHIARRANLDADTLAIAPDNLGGTVAYAPLESIEVIERPDLVPKCVHLIYRSRDNINGTDYLRLSTDHAGPGSKEDEGALVRTIELTGLSYSSTVLEQKVRVTPLTSSLTATGTITSGIPFEDLERFWKRKVGWLNAAGVVITAFRGTARTLTDVDAAGTLNTSLHDELIEGAVTPWMEGSSLARIAQDQTFACEIDYTRDGVKGTASLSSGALATNCTSRIYRFTESESISPAEPTPTGMATAIYGALSVLPCAGTVRQIEEECSLSIRPGKVLNLTGGRTGWENMRALVQSTAADLDTGSTALTFGPPEHLGPQDLVALLRTNRFRPIVIRALLRATGTL